jgi:hypothetical protein
MYVPSQLLCQALTATATDSDYTVQAGIKVIIKSCLITNPTASPITVVGRITPTGGSAKTFIPKVVMPSEPLSIYELDNHVLEAGDIIDFTGNGANIILSGIKLPIS